MDQRAISAFPRPCFIAPWCRPMSARPPNIKRVSLLVRFLILWQGQAMNCNALWETCRKILTSFYIDWKLCDVSTSKVYSNNILELYFTHIYTHAQPQL
jgi:hypothetical protein